MSKRILVVPDIHGETFWREPVQRYIDQVDRIVFLGDYLDPYKDEGKDYSPQGLSDNLMDIVDLKNKNKDKVVLLIGNHDFHYYSKRTLDLVRASRCDLKNWRRYNQIFNDNEDIFKVAHLETIKGVPYLFSHAGLTTYWINKVNSKLWKLNDRDISIGEQWVIDMINGMLTDWEGQNMLGIVGKSRSVKGENSGSAIWADIEDHAFPVAPKAYGLNKVFQVFGHSRLDSNKASMIEFENIALIDSQQCFMIDEDLEEKIVPLRDYEKDKISR